MPTVEQAKEMQRQKEQSQKEKEREEEGRKDHPPQADKETPREPSAEEAALTRALAERQDKERAALYGRQSLETERRREELAAETVKETESFDFWQQARRRAERQADDSRTLLPKIWDFIQEAFFPKKRREREAQRERLEDARDTRDEKAKTEFLDGLRQKQGIKLEDLDALHEQQIREQDAKHEAETSRYLKEHEAAQRLLAEIEEQRREAERSRDGPDPPKRAR